MECGRCGRDTVIHAACSGARLCDDHFCTSIEKRMRRRIREDNMLPRDASPKNPQMRAIGPSGGKDGVALTHILDDAFGHDPRTELIALTIREGIESYRDKSVDTCIELAEDLDTHYELVTYEDKFGVQMGDVVEKDPKNMVACAYYGVFRRDLPERLADKLDADKLFTGHNLDDEVQATPMNFFEGDLKQVAKHFGAGTGNSEKQRDAGEFIPRAKPLRDVPEKEITLCAHLKDLPVHIVEYPHPSEAYHSEIQQLLLELGEDHPGTQRSITAGCEELAELATREYHGEGYVDLNDYERCGSKTADDVCRRCRLIESIEAV